MSLDPVLADIPVATPPPGVIPNFVDPPTIRTGFVANVATSMSLVGILLVLRIFVKLRLIKRWDLDDTLFALAVLVFFVWNIVYLQHKFLSLFSRHQWDLRVGDIIYVSYYGYVLEILYPPSMMLAKLSVLVQIKKLFTGVFRDSLFYCIWVSIVATVLSYGVAFFLFAFRCNPIRKSWDDFLPGHCMNIYYLETSLAIANVATDFSIAILPIWAILRLHTAAKKMFELIALFGCGIFGIVLGSVGLHFRIHLSTNPELIRGLAIIAMFCIAENAIVILIGCIPAIARLFHPAPKQLNHEPPVIIGRAKHSKDENSLSFLDTVDTKVEYNPSSPSKHIESNSYGLADEKYTNQDNRGSTWTAYCETLVGSVTSESELEKTLPKEYK